MRLNPHQAFATEIGGFVNSVYFSAWKVLVDVFNTSENLPVFVELGCDKDFFVLMLLVFSGTIEIVDLPCHRLANDESGKFVKITENGKRIVRMWKDGVDIAI